MYLGPFSNEWGRALSCVSRWQGLLEPLPGLVFPALVDPAETIKWLMETEMAHRDRVHDACVKLAQFPHARMPKLGRIPRYFLAERLRTVRPVLAAISTTCEQALTPVCLFPLPQYEGLLEQQLLWATVAYWDELGYNYWLGGQINLFYYAARCNGWKNPRMPKPGEDGWGES